jgi:hypothetical protein
MFLITSGYYEVQNRRRIPNFVIIINVQRASKAKTINCYTFTRSLLHHRSLFAIISSPKFFTLSNDWTFSNWSFVRAPISQFSGFKYCQSNRVSTNARLLAFPFPKCIISSLERYVRQLVLIRPRNRTVLYFTRATHRCNSKGKKQPRFSDPSVVSTFD